MEVLHTDRPVGRFGRSDWVAVEESPVGDNTSARVWTAGVLGGLLVLAACAPAEDGDQTAAGEATSTADVDAPDDPTPGGSLTMGLEAESSGWAPWADSWSTPVWVVARSFYDTLMERDEDGVPQPNLAESVEANDDYTAYTLTLREGIEFHDGEPLDAEAVVANFELHREDGSRTASRVAVVEDVVAEDELTVRFELDEPNVAFVDEFTHAAGVVVSPASIEAGDTSENPVGTGPFVFESWQRDQQLEVTRNEDYWREDLPYLDEITFRPIPDEESRLQSLLAGDVDVIHTLSAGTVAQARDRADGYNLYEASGNSAGSVIFNVEEPPLDDQRVREGFAYGVSRAEVIAVGGGADFVPPALGLFNAESPWYVEEIEDLWPDEDLERAEAAVSDYIDDPDRSDGQEPGSPVTFTFDTPPDPALLEQASIYQAQLERVGIEIDIDGVEQAVHIQEAVAGDFQAKAWRMGDEEDPDSWLVPTFGPDSPVNYMNFESEELVDLLLEARRTPDLDDRRDLYHEAQRILAEEIPFVTMGRTVNLLATVSNVYGFDDWDLPDGDPGVGHPESMARWHSVWRDQDA
jgi:peptide/nickel transport system substrate-binding protein